jgi:hypothetical protein
MQIIPILMILLIIYLTLRWSNPRKNANERLIIIKDKVESLGGILTNVKQIKRAECPYGNEVEFQDGYVHNYYKIQYMIGDKIKEGYSILKMQQTLVGSIGVHECEWEWKL